MRRILMVGAVVAAVALPAVATGAAETASTERARGSQLRINFILETLGNKPVAIKDFEFEDLEATCDGAVTLFIKGHINAMRVRDNRRFGATINRNGKRVRVAGVVRRQKIRGTIRASGSYGQQTNCDSGRVPWVAQRN